MKFNLVVLTFAIFLTSCFSDENKKKDSVNEKTELGAKPLNYYADKTVKPLEVPPDLTMPNYENSLRISEFASGVDENIIDFLNTDESKDQNTIIIININDDILVKKSGNRRWLVIKRDADTVWNLSKEFLKKKGFTLKKTNKKIGIIETDFLENYPEVPTKNLGMLRRLLQDALKARYSLPIIDKYRVRIEPLDNNTTEFHLSLFSMQEKLTQSGNIETTVWEAYEKDISLETEMLYQFMLYLGGEEVKVKEKILEAKEDNKIKVQVVDSINGFAKMKFETNLLNTWDNLNWALDQINADIEDRDIKEKSFYVRLVTEELGFISKILGSDALIDSYQILLKEVDKDLTEVYLNDISGKNDEETKKFSYKFFNQIKTLF